MATVIPFIKTNHKVYLPEGFRAISDEIENFTVRNDDIWLLGYPKSGTTWAQEMIWCIGNNLDFERSKTTPIDDKFPCLELQMFDDPFGIESADNSVNFCKQQSSPRFLKSHLPWHFLPKQLKYGEVKPKYVYIHRDPRDVVISFVDFVISMNYSFIKQNPSFEDWSEVMLTDEIFYGPYWDHVNSAYEISKSMTNLLIISYEEMKKDLESVIRKTAKHMNVDLNDQQINDLKNHLSFDSMKQNKSVAIRVYKNEVKQFLSKGTVGRHKDILSPEMIQRFDKWEKERKMF